MVFFGVELEQQTIMAIRATKGMILKDFILYSLSIIIVFCFIQGRGVTTVYNQSALFHSASKSSPLSVRVRS